MHVLLTVLTVAIFYGGLRSRGNTKCSNSHKIDLYIKLVFCTICADCADRFEWQFPMPVP